MFHFNSRLSSLFFFTTSVRKPFLRSHNKCLLFRTLHDLNSKEIDHIHANALFSQLSRGDRGALSRAITLVESQNIRKQTEAKHLLKLVLSDAKRKYESHGQKSLSFRIGLTGPPGAGKSTFIETFGKFLTKKGYRVAVLAVDPSSSTTGGSLLGDKTRMPELSCDRNAFIRPSPASGCLGGVTRSTNESIALFECAGYNVIIIETVGVGQSEYHVSYMVDMFVLLVSPAGGDELQGLKKGIVELADIVVINKADGDLLPNARLMQAEYISALKFVRKRCEVWKPVVKCISSRTSDGIPNLWEEMEDFRETLLESGDYEAKRRQQYKMWMWFHVEYRILELFKKNSHVREIVSSIEEQVLEGTITPGQGSDILLKKFLGTD